MQSIHRPSVFGYGAAICLASGCSSGRLGRAILERDLQAVQRLLDEGANPNLSIVRTDFWAIGLSLDFDVLKDKPFLTTAVELGEVEIVRALLEAGADPNIITDAPSPLFYAGNPYFVDDHVAETAPVRREAEMTRILLHYGADPNLITHPDSGSAPIHCASELETMLVLFPITQDRWYTEQFVANRRQHPFGPLVSALTDMRRRHEYPLTPANLRSFPPLTQAVLQKNVPLLLDLIRQKPETVDERDRYGFTALMWAASRVGDPDCVPLLLEAGADPNAQGDGQWTPLHSAIEADSASLIRQLCSAGADPNHRIHYQRERESPIMLAAHYRHLDSFRALLDSGADPLERVQRLYQSTGLLDWARFNPTEDRREIFELANRLVNTAEFHRPTSPNQP